MAVPLQSKTHSTKQLYESMALNSADMSTRRCVHPRSPRQSLAANPRATTYHSSYTVVYVLGETLSVHLLRSGELFPSGLDEFRQIVVLCGTVGSIELSHSAIEVLAFLFLAV
jgi:hypothetical protein